MSAPNLFHHELHIVEPPLSKTLLTITLINQCCFLKLPSAVAVPTVGSADMIISYLFPAPPLSIAYFLSTLTCWLSKT